MDAPVYLFVGPEIGERNSAVEEIKKAAQKKFGTLDEHHIYLLETPLNQAMSILQNGTLFSDGVFIICKNAEVIKKKEEVGMIKSWIESNPLENAILILISDEISVAPSLEKIIPPKNFKKFWEMFENKRLPWLQKFFSNNGYQVEESACQLILEMVENNTQSLSNEAMRLMGCFPQTHTITCDDVDSVLTHNREESVFTLFNYISQSTESPEKRFENGLNILQKVRLSKENSSVAIIAGLISCFRKLTVWHQLNDNAQYAVDEFTLKKNGFSGSLMQKQYRSAAKIWTAGQCAAILAILASTDMEIRSSGTSLEDVLLQKMLYEIIIKKGAQMAVCDWEFN